MKPTGYEPHLVSANTAKKPWRLAPRHLATMLNLLPVEAIALPVIEATLQHENFLVRSEAAKRLVKRNDREARLVLQRVLTNGEAPARANIARHLYGLTWFAVKPMFDQAFQDTDYRVREGAVYALCKIGTLDALHYLHAQLLNETEDAVLGAPAMEWGLYERHDPYVIEVFKLSLRAQDPEIRAKIMDTLGTTGLVQAIPLVRETMLTDVDNNVVYQAALSYVELAGADCIADFVAIINTLSSPDRLRFILRGFFHATNYQHVDLAHHPHVDDLLQAFYGAMQSPDIAVREQTIFCLAWLQHPRVAELIWEVYQAEQVSELKAHILFVSVSLMVDNSEVLLADAEASPDVNVRAMAARIRDDRARKPDS